MWHYFIVCLILILILDYVLKQKYSMLKKQVYAGNVRSYPIIGAAHIFMGNNESKLRQFQILGDLGTKHGKGLFGAFFAYQFYVLITDPEAAQLVLKNCLEKAEVYRKPLSLMFGDGIIFAPVPIWRHRRRTLYPIFNTRSLNEMVQIFAKQSSKLAQCLKDKVGTGPFPLEKYTYNSSIISVCGAVMGIELDSNDDESNTFLNANGEAFHLLMDRLPRPWLHWDSLYKLTAKYAKFKKATDQMHSFILKIIHQKRKKLQENNGEEKMSFLEQLITSSTYTDQQLIEEILSLAVAATDTTAVSVGFTMMMMARHPQVQEKVYAELEEVFGDSDRHMEPEDLKRLVYLEAVVKETLRLYPAVPAIGREVTTEVELPLGVKLMEGCGAGVSIWGIHRNPQFWGPDADLFRPERFLDTPLVHPAQFMPFSYGPRNCIGLQYAMMSVKTTVATLLRQYRVLPPIDGADLRLTIDIVMREFNGYIVEIESRKK